MNLLRCFAGLILAGLVVLPAFAQDTMPPTVLDSKTFTMQFDHRTVQCQATISVEGGLEPGDSASVFIDLASSIQGDYEEETARAVVLNGIVVVALPHCFELLGEIRPFLFDPATGGFEFMYSKRYPAKGRFAGMGSAQDDATSDDAGRIWLGLGQLAGVLDPTVSLSGPSDPRLDNTDPDYHASGKSWLIPCNVMYEDLVDPFEPENSMVKGGQLRIKVPLKVVGHAIDPKAVVFVGGLSTAVAKVELLPSEIPDTAIPLAPVPEQPVEPPAEPATEDGKDAAEASEKTENDKQEVELVAPPEPIPTLIFSHEWIAWETEVSLACLGDPVSTAAFSFSGEPEQKLEYIEPPGEEPLVIRPAETSERTALEAATPAVTDSTASEPAETAPTPDSEPAAPDSASGAREVEPGTLPQQAEDYIVPIKEITGSAGLPAVQPPRPGESAPGGSPAVESSEMILIPEGYFLMGTSHLASAGDQDELPQTQVYLPAFYIDKYPVSNRQFYQFTVEAGYRPEGDWEKYYAKGTADLPVRRVTWNDAQAYAKWAGKRLPSEAEWEKAARGEDGRIYPWGDEWSSEILPRSEIIYDILHAESAASPFGVMGMCGMLWQWTDSAWAPYPYDPQARGDMRVLRGGCFSNGRNIVRCANRYAEPPQVALNTFTFRCAKDAP